MQALGEVLDPSKIKVIVGTSVGTINSVLIAKHIQEGTFHEGINKLPDFWREQARVENIFDSHFIGALERMRMIFKSFSWEKLKKEKIWYIFDLFNDSLKEISSWLRFRFFISWVLFVFFFYLLTDSITSGILITILLGIIIFIAWLLINGVIIRIVVGSFYTKGFLTSQTGFVELLKSILKKKGVKKNDVKVVITATNLTGKLLKVGHHQANSKSHQYELVTHADQWTITDISKENINDLILKVRASSSFPFVFPRIKIGKYYYTDGGIKNHAPLNSAINEGADLIIIISPHPYEGPRINTDYSNVKEFIGRFVSIIFEETVKNDIVNVEKMNKKIAKLEELEAKLSKKGLSPTERALLDEYKKVAGIKQKKHINIIQVRPQQRLGNNNPFEGFFDPKRIEQYLEQGKADGALVKEEIEKLVR